jgi:hypothetical protein
MFLSSGSYEIAKMRQLGLASANAPDMAGWPQGTPGRETFKKFAPLKMNLNKLLRACHALFSVQVVVFQAIDLG